MYGAIAGDIIGSTFERGIWSGHGWQARCIGYDVTPTRGDRSNACALDFELFAPGSFPTDDSIETIAVMQWLLDGGDLAKLLREYFRRYPEAGFGSKFAEWAAADTDAPCGSFGNGAAMRVSPVAYVASSEVEVLALAESSARVTHGTPDAIAGAQAVALAVFYARKQMPKEQIAAELSKRFGYDLQTPIDTLRQGYRFSSLCPLTVPAAIRAFLETTSVETAIRRAISLGGDSDTIASIAAAIAEAYYGIPEEFVTAVRALLPSELRLVVDRFLQR